MKIFNLLKCKDYARVDFRLDSNISYFLEINTHPGFTSTSLFPMAAKQKGISFSQLIKKNNKNLKKKFFFIVINKKN